MNFKKLLLLTLVLQIPFMAFPQEPQNKENKSADKIQQQQQEIDPGLSLLLSCVGITVGGFVTLCGAGTTIGGVFLVSPEGPNNIGAKVGGIAVASAGLGITYVGAKMMWFYLKRGGKTLFSK